MLLWHAYLPKHTPTPPTCTSSLHSFPCIVIAPLRVPLHPHPPDWEPLKARPVPHRLRQIGSLLSSLYRPCHRILIYAITTAQKE